MFEAPIAVFDRVQQKDIPLERRAQPGMPEADLRFANASGIGNQPLAIEIGQCTADNEFMRNTMRNKTAAPELTQLDRMVDQFIVIGGNINALPARIDSR